MKLYHATYKARIESIKQFGLGAKQFKNWNISEDGKVYFAIDPYVAESYCEVAEDVEEDVYNSGIVILEVDSSNLDQRLFCRDGNQRDENCSTIAYRGIIPYKWLRVWNETE